MELLLSSLAGLLDCWLLAAKGLVLLARATSAKHGLKSTVMLSLVCLTVGYQKCVCLFFLMFFLKYKPDSLTFTEMFAALLWRQIQQGSESTVATSSTGSHLKYFPF